MLVTFIITDIKFKINIFFFFVRIFVNFNTYKTCYLLMLHKQVKLKHHPAFAGWCLYQNDSTDLLRNAFVTSDTGEPKICSGDPCSSMTPFAMKMTSSDT